ncbi:GtrA family protein [Xanthomonas campestris pv. paulliniae]|uniref:GtrA family protein n=1 Tax=Xanthomonas euvesicatoria TaxID=456327 RepID=UPI001C44209D|nr:GtrA family protein [Xanthomonas euvesicatoria]MBV6844715.1 GtrA family protein [Xanthomonas campestris pv. paulliniae]
MISQQFLRFIVAGGTAAAVNFGSRIALSNIMPYAPAIIVAYIIGMITAFLLNKRFVFAQSGNALHHQAAWFVAINMLAVLQTLAVSLLLARWLFPAIGMRFHAEAVAHLVGVAVPVFTSYAGHKALTFRELRS